MEFEDAHLVSRCLDGDDDAFEGLVKRYQRAVYGTAYYYVRDVSAAEDLTQETFFTAYRNLVKLKDFNRFAPWLKGIATRLASSWLSQHRKEKDARTPLPFRRTVSLEDARQTPRGRMEQEERLEWVHRAIDSLPERHRLPVVLRYMQEYSYEEIGDFIGESTDHVRGVLHRAGRQLRDILGELEQGEGEQGWHRARE